MALESMVIDFDFDISPLSQNPRKVFVYLPSNYEESNISYPCLYMFDGQNLFFDEYATFGKSWDLKTFFDNYDKEFVVVGIDCNHIENLRLNEYTPYPFEFQNEKIEPLGKITSNWLVTKLKPYIDNEFKTLSDSENTYIGGSSMGGLIALYSFIKYNDTFSKCAALSPSINFVYDNIYKLINKTKLNTNSKLYISYGSKEIGNGYRQAKTLKDLLDLNHLLSNTKNISVYPDLIINGRHSEETWATQVPTYMDYLSLG